MNHIGRQVSLKLCVACKYDDRIDVLWSERKERLNGFCMFIVLPQRIHEAIPLPEYYLSPLP